MKQVSSVTFIGDNDEKSEALVFGTPGDTADLLVIDSNSGATKWERDVPKREYPSSDGNGRTWH